MHYIWSIREVLHHILTSLEDLVPKVTTDGELRELIAEVVKHNL